MQAWTPAPGPRAPAADSTPHSTHACRFKPPGRPLQTAHSTFSGWRGGWGAGTPSQEAYKAEGGPGGDWGLATRRPHGSAALGAPGAPGALGAALHLRPHPLPGPSLAPRAAPTAAHRELAFAAGVTAGPVIHGGRSERAWPRPGSAPGPAPGPLPALKPPQPQLSRTPVEWEVLASQGTQEVSVPVLPRGRERHSTPEGSRWAVQGAGTRKQARRAPWRRQH